MRGAGEWEVDVRVVVGGLFFGEGDYRRGERGPGPVRRIGLRLRSVPSFLSFVSLDLKCPPSTLISPRHFLTTPLFSGVSLLDDPLVDPNHPSLVLLGPLPSP